MDGRAQRGLQIHAAGGQIRRISDTTYAVRSQTIPGVQHMLVQTSGGWDCSCPDDVQYCKHGHALEARLGAKARADRALLMHNMGGQVERIADDHYRQVTELRPDVRGAGLWERLDVLVPGPPVHSSHMQAHSGGAVQERGAHHHTGAGRNQCVDCPSTDIMLKGKSGAKQRQQYGCKKCGRRFMWNPGFERMRHNPNDITDAVDMLYAGQSTRKVSTTLAKRGVKATHMTVLNWTKRFGSMMEWFAESLGPLVGESWRTDEVYMKILGERKYLFAMLDADTRYWIARQVATHKGTDDVKPMFRKARQVAGKTPSKLISDGASNFAEAHKDEYTPRNYLWKESTHESHIRMDGDPNNNQMESFNGNTIRMREKVACGLKSENSAILAGLQIYHNFIRPHLGLPAHMTPAEAAGIHVEGEDKILTLVRAAAVLGMELRAADRPDGG